MVRRWTQGSNPTGTRMTSRGRARIGSKSGSPRPEASVCPRARSTRRTRREVLQWGLPPVVVPQLRPPLPGAAGKHRRHREGGTPGRRTRPARLPAAAVLPRTEGRELTRRCPGRIRRSPVAGPVESWATAALPTRCRSASSDDDGKMRSSPSCARGPSTCQPSRFPIFLISYGGREGPG